MSSSRRIKSFTLIELLIAAIMMSVIVGITIPVYTKTIENAKARTARTTLKLIQHGKRVYKLERGFYFTIAETDPDNYWADVKLDNPNVVLADSGYRFSVEGAATPIFTTGLKGKARRTNDNGTYEIDEAGNVTNPDGKLPVITY